MLTWILIWFMFAVASSSIASAKGYSGGLWFLAGLFFGPFGLIVGFYPSVKQTDAKKSNRPAQANSRKCPQCAEEILVAAIKCKHCGSGVPPLPLPLPPDPPTSAEKEQARIDERNKSLFGLGAFLLLCLLVGYGCSGR